MANLKDISTVPELKSLEGTEKVLLNVDGSARQASAKLVKNATKELMYEWNFSADDDVHYIDVNVDDDLTWLTTKSDDVDFEIVMEQYYCGYSSDDDTPVVIDNATFYGVLAKNAIYANNITWDDICVKNQMGLFSEASTINTHDWANKVCASVSVSNGVHYNAEDDVLTAVETGGNIYVYEDCECPIKSVKIYKITK